MSSSTAIRPYHPPIYYKVRTVVRATFWTLVMYGFILLASWISQIGDKPACPITLNDDFTYSTQAPFDANQCDPGVNITLFDTNRWGWTQ